MGHGGKRTGAGRKRKITNPLERWSVGELCSSKWIEEAERQEDKRIEERPRQHPDRAVYKRLDQLLRRFTNVTNAPAWEMQKLWAEVEKIEKSGRYRNIRPKGCREEIISTVAKDTGHPRRMVQRCWVEYNAWIRQITPATSP